jgi:hypothetical protein
MLGAIMERVIIVSICLILFLLLSIFYIDGATQTDIYNHSVTVIFVGVFYAVSLLIAFILIIYLIAKFVSHRISKSNKKYNKIMIFTFVVFIICLFSSLLTNDIVIYFQSELTYNKIEKIAFALKNSDEDIYRQNIENIHTFIEKQKGISLYTYFGIFSKSKIVVSKIENSNDIFIDCPCLGGLFFRHKLSKLQYWSFERGWNFYK